MADTFDDIPADILERTAALPDASRESVTPAEWASLTARLRAMAQAEGTLHAYESVLPQVTLRDDAGGGWWFDGQGWRLWRDGGWVQATPPAALHARAPHLEAPPPVPETLDEIFPRCWACNNPGAPTDRFCLLCGTDRTLPPGSAWRCLLCGGENRGQALSCTHCGWTRPTRASAPTCAGCGAPLLPSAAFCTGCGTPAPVAATVAATRFCVNCRTALAHEARFCLSCGAAAP